MDRSGITKLLTDTLIRTRLNGRVHKKYYATEVTLDYGLKHPKRIDVMEYKPVNQLCISGLEGGIFICYEIKSCYEDVYSGSGLNFYGDKNYIVTTMETYKKLIPDIQQTNKFRDHLRKTNPESSLEFGIMVLVPEGRNSNNGAEREFFDTTEITNNERWELHIIKKDRGSYRKKSIIELLFCMLRSGR